MTESTPRRRKERPNPILKANLFQRITFGWVSGLFLLAWKRPLEPTDIYDVLPKARAAYRAEKFMRRWRKLPERERKRKGSLVKYLLLSNWKTIAIGWSSAVDALSFLAPFVIGEFVKHMDGTKRISDWAVAGLVATLVVVSLLSTTLNAHVYHSASLSAMDLRTTCGALILRKAAITAHAFFLAPVDVIAVFALAALDVGLAVWVGIGIIVLFVGLRIMMSSRQSRLRLIAAGWTDKLVNLMGEIISSMRVLKMYCWENAFAKKATDLRRTETETQLRSTLLLVLGITTSAIFGKIVTFGILITHLWLREDLVPEVTLRILGWIKLMETTVFLNWAWNFGSLSEMFTATARIQNFLNAEEVGDGRLQEVEEQAKDAEVILEGVSAILGERSQTTIPINSGDVATEESSRQNWTPFTLRNITMSAKAGNLVVILGPVGSGKSSLLLTILGEVPVSHGSRSLHGSVAYVPQEAWILSDTIKANILFGTKMDHRKYKAVIRACALRPDIALMPKGDQTLVGERGLSLSGGQKARINLARAAYSGADIFLLDDPFSAVDGQVGSYIFEKCINGILKSKLRILVTHQLQYLRYADRVIVLDKGALKAVGSYQEVSANLHLEDIVAKSPTSRNFPREASFPSSAHGVPGVPTGNGAVSVAVTSQPTNGVSVPVTSQPTVGISGPVTSDQTVAASVPVASEPTDGVSGPVASEPTKTIKSMRSGRLTRSKLHRYNEIVFRNDVIFRTEARVKRRKRSVDRKPESNDLHSRRHASRKRKRNRTSIGIAIISNKESSRVRKRHVNGRKLSAGKVRRRDRSATTSRKTKKVENRDRDVGRVSATSASVAVTAHDRRRGLEKISDEVAEIEDVEEGADLSTEVQERGRVSLAVYSQYLKAGYGSVFLPLLVFFLTISGGTDVASDWWMVNWYVNSSGILAPTDNISTEQTTTVMETDIRDVAILVVVFIVSSCMHAIVLSVLVVLASRRLYNAMFTRLMRTPVTFFERNPVGQILNRFSRDTGFMDHYIPFTLLLTVYYLFRELSFIVYVCVIEPWMVPGAVAFMAGVCLTAYFTIGCIRDIKRIEGAPILEGTVVIRAFDMEERFLREADDRMDRHTAAWFLFIATRRYMGYRVDLLAAIFGITAMIVIIATQTDESQAGPNGLSFTYLLFMLSTAQYIIVKMTELETFMTSAERIQQYARLDQEAPAHTNIIPPTGWPDRGTVCLENVYLTYPDTATPALGPVTLTVRGGHRVGIVGRTGAGKSSLLVCLLRLVEPTGRIVIDDIDVTKMGLTDLRRAISVIPQDPMLFTGTVRFNIDPLGEFSNRTIWNVLSMVELRQHIESLPGELSAEMGESGGNFSVGQRQLLCLARALLRRNKIIIIDEATANLDERTDSIIQSTLSRGFSGCTLLTTAHRLKTIINYDRVMVFDYGKVVQYDHPYLLLQQTSGVFHKMALQSGPSVFEELSETALQAYTSRTIHETGAFYEGDHWANTLT